MALVAKLLARVDALAGDVARVDALAADVARLSAENERLRAELAKNSGNSSKPPSRDPAAERQRQAEERRAKKARGTWIPGRVGVN